jgi:hypothetical protein
MLDSFLKKALSFHSPSQLSRLGSWIGETLFSRSFRKLMRNVAIDTISEKVLK